MARRHRSARRKPSVTSLPHGQAADMFGRMTPALRRAARACRRFASLSVLVGGTFAGRSVRAQVFPPPPPGTDSVTVVPGDYCAASRAFAALAGNGYRRLWITPIRVPVADLGRLGGGGLTPDHLGGGMTTQTLHVLGADGQRYVLRSVQKTTRQALAEEFWDTPVETIYRDQLCSFHPSGALIVARLLDELDVLHTHPQLYVVPDDPRLGDFREQFAGMLVLFEERADERPDGGPGFAGSRRVVQAQNLLDDLEEDPGDQLAAEELLRSRLVDVLVGDRDRSLNNHLWARFDEPDGGHLWRVIPRDRDQAFIRYDGVAKTLGRIYDNRLVSFGDEYPNMEGLTRTAWDIDRHLLVGISREHWDAAVRQVQERLTDAVISAAVHRMPPEHYALVGPQLEASLRTRRDHLGQAAARMYETVFRDPEIHVTDADELATVDGLADGRVRVAVYRRSAGPDAGGRPHYQRTFSPAETDEIRLWLHGGDDSVRVRGEGASPILVRVIGGGGRDELVDEWAGGRVVLYDGGDGTRVTGDARLVRKDPAPLYSWWTEGRGDLDWGADSFAEPAVAYDGDRGIVLGLGLRRDGYGFLHRPFSSRTSVSGGWAIGRSEPILELREILQDRIAGRDLGLHARYSGIEIVRFYGLGNGTPESESERYYRVRQKQLTLGAELSLGDGDRRRLSLGPVFRYTSSDTTKAASFIARNRPYGTGTFAQAGLLASFDIDGRDVRQAPSRGYHVTGGGAWYAGGLDVASSFGEAHAEVASYLSPGRGNPTLALRAGGRKLWGTFPYSDAAFIGGAADVRGLREQRYAGNASLYGSAELRVFVTRFLLVFPIDFGVFGLADAGRVFARGDSSDAWHDAWGGGLWFAPLYRSATIHVSFARSDELTRIHLGTGFAF